MNVVDAQDVSVALDGRQVLHGVDLGVRPGEVVAVLGANGSGKSTLVKAVVGLHPATRGEIRLFGEPLARFDDWHRIGYVPQRSRMGEGVPATVAEVVSSGRLSRRTPLLPMRRRDRQAVARALDMVGLGDLARQPVATLSGGQQQRVLLARTLAGEPELLFLDEPLAGVDLASQDALADTVRELTDGNATVVVVLHELGPFADLIQRSVVLRDGHKVYDGPALSGHGHRDHEEGHHHPHPSVPPLLRPPVEAPLDR